MHVSMLGGPPTRLDECRKVRSTSDSSAATDNKNRWVQRLKGCSWAGDLKSETLMAIFVFLLVGCELWRWHFHTAIGMFLSPWPSASQSHAASVYWVFGPHPALLPMELSQKCQSQQKNFRLGSILLLTLNHFHIISQLISLLLYINITLKKKNVKLQIGLIHFQLLVFEENIFLEIIFN